MNKWQVSYKKDHGSKYEVKQKKCYELAQHSVS